MDGLTESEKERVQIAVAVMEVRFSGLAVRPFGDVKIITEPKIYKTFKVSLHHGANGRNARKVAELERKAGNVTVLHLVVADFWNKREIVTLRHA